MEENKTPVNQKSWTNPSIGITVNNGNINSQVENNTKEINELKKEINELKEELSKYNNGEVKETVKVEEPKKELDMPFDSPFSEAISDTTEVVNNDNNTVQDILESVKEDVPEKPVEEEEEVPSFADMLVEENQEKISVVINRYNSDIEATTKGKGAKYVSLTEAEHKKLLSGKIN